MTRRFIKGDWVRVAKDLGQSMRHFTADCEAIVIGSYGDEYGGNNHRELTIHIRGKGKTSWYYDHQLTLIEPNRMDRLRTWEAEKAAFDREKSDLDWIFSNGEEVEKNGYGASIAALAVCFGLDNLWGARGEGITYFENARLTLGIALPYLRTGDKAGYLSHCSEIKPEAA